MSYISATPFKINNMELKNRIIMLAMHTGFATGGQLTDQDMAFFEQRANSGAAAITQVCGVSEYGAADNMPNVKEESFFEREKAINDMIHNSGTKHIVQLFHRGRKASVLLKHCHEDGDDAPDHENSLNKIVDCCGHIAAHQHIHAGQ